MKNIANKILQGASVFALAIAFVGAVSVFTTPVAYADCDTSELSITSGANCGQGTGQPAELFDGDDSLFKKITDVMLFIIGAVSVIMLIVGGIRYTISGGDQGSVQAAKNTILYAIVGIVVAILAYAVVAFVTGAFVEN